MATENGDKMAVERLFFSLLAAWNRRDAAEFAALFDSDATVVGFDGSQMNGPTTIANTLQSIFTDHQTASYVAKVREICMLAPNVGLLQAVCGMVPPGQTDLNPAVNAIQTLIATKHTELWKIRLFQNTPAQFHGRPEATEALTAELRECLQHQQIPQNRV